MKILILTSKYPYEGGLKKFTPVVHYFAREWVRQGHEVCVIHNQSLFPSLLYSAARPILHLLETRFGFPVPTSEMNTEASFILEGVSVHRFLIFRIFPFIRYLRPNIVKQLSRIKHTLKKSNFHPDVIVGHWMSPQLELLTELKASYRVRIALVLHSNNISWGLNHDDVQRMLSQVDVVGFRSEGIKRSFLSRFDMPDKSFLCRSGVPENLINSLACVKHLEVSKVMFAGMLIRRKHADKVIRAIAAVSCDFELQLEIYGVGPELPALKTIVKSLAADTWVTFKGHTSREDVLEAMENAQLFVMISEKEAYGLVYIEAMAKGCIVIASRNEGGDGFIVDGYNGFLCPAGDVEYLEQIIKRLKLMNPKERESIAINAIMTAKNMTDQIMAEEYLANVI